MWSEQKLLWQTSCQETHLLLEVRLVASRILLDAALQSQTGVSRQGSSYTSAADSVAAQLLRKCCT